MTTGTLSVLGETDTFQVSLVAGQGYLFDLNGLTNYASLSIAPEVLSDQGELAFGSELPAEPGSPQPQSAFFRPMTSGTYTVAVSDPSTTSPYTITARAVSTDYTDTPNTTGHVATGGSTTGSLSVAGQHDWIAVTLTGGQAYEVHLDGLSDYAQIAVAAADLLEENTASATPTGFYDVTDAAQTAFFRPSSNGTYYIDVSDPAQTGTYSVSIDAVATDTTDNTYTNKTVAVGGSVNGSLTVPGQDDWIAVTLTAGQAYAITLDGLTGAPTLEVGTSNALSSDDGEGLTTPEAIGGAPTRAIDFFRPATTQAYYIDVGDGGDTGNYTVGVQAIATDVTNDASTMGSIVIGGSAQGSFATIGQHDWLAVTLSAGQAYAVQATGVTGLEIALPEFLTGEQIVSTGIAADSAVTPGTFNAFITPPVGGTYYVDVSSEAGRGSYTASIIPVSTDYTNNEDTAGRVLVGGSLTGTLTTPGQQDWIGVDLVAGQAYVVTLSGLDELASFEIQPLGSVAYGFAAAGGEEATFPPGTQSAFFDPKYSGEYYVAIDDATALGTYTLSVAAVSAGSSPGTLMPVGGGTITSPADPIFSSLVLAFGDARVGDDALTASTLLSNDTTASSTEDALSYSLPSLADPFSSVGATNGVVQSGGSTSLGLLLNTSTSGNLTETETVSLGSVETNDTIVPLATQSLLLEGTVYATAAATLSTTQLDFGTVHVGDYDSLGVGVSNAATGDLTDTLDATITTLSPGFDAAGSVSLDAGDSGTLMVTLDTATAGTVGGTAMLGFTSHDAALPDLSLAPQTVSLAGTIDNYARPLLTAAGGTLTGSGDTYVLDLGTMTVGDTPSFAALTLENGATGPADLLTATGSAQGNDAFANSAFAVATGLGAGEDGLLGYVSLDTTTAGTFTETLSLLPTGSNASGYSAALPTQTVIIEGVVAAPTTPPTETPPPLPTPAPISVPDNIVEANVSPAAVNFGLVPLGNAVQAPLTIGNVTPSIAIDAAIASITGDATATGSVSALPSGSSNVGGINVGVGTGSTGLKSGDVTIAVGQTGTDRIVQTSELDFKTTGQSLWGTGSANLPGQAFTLANGSLSAAGSIVTGLAAVSVTGSVSDTLSLALGSGLGTASVSYPVTSQLGLPTAVAPGTAFTVGTGESGVGDISLQTNFPGFSSATLSNSIAGSLSGTATVPSLAPQVLSTGEFEQTQSLTVSNTDLTLSKDIAGVVDVSLGLPSSSIETQSETPPSGSGSLPDLIAEGEQNNDFLTISGNLLKAFPALGELDLDGPGFDFDAVSLEAELGVAIGQEFIFAPSAVMVTMAANFAPNDPVTQPLGDTFTFDLPSTWTAPVVLTTSYQLIGTLENETSLASSAALKLVVGELTFKPDQLGLELPDVGLGPIAEQTLAKQGLGNILSLPATEPFMLGGFNSPSTTSTIAVATDAPNADSAAALPNQKLISVAADVYAVEGGGSGDTHLTTFDGLHYDFQAAGEFVLAQDSGIEIQVRIEPNGGAQHPIGQVSYIEQTAIGLGADRVTIDFTRADPLWIDGVAQTLAAGGTLTLTSGNVIDQGGTYLVTANDGDAAQVSNETDQVYLATTTGVSGLLGNANGDPTHDLALPNSAVLTQPLSFTELYGTFANAWRVTDATSLLDYGPGEITATYTNIAFPPAPITLADLPASIAQAALQRAAALGITNVVDQQNTALDLVLGGDDPVTTASDLAASTGDTATAALALTDGATPPLLGISGPLDPLPADASSAQLEAFLTAPEDNTVTVDYTVLDPGLADVLGTAAFAGMLPSGSVTIASGQLLGVINIALPSNLGTAARRLEVGISSPTPGVLLANAEASVLIEAACYVAGTRILTARGEVAIEALQVGDLAMGLLGRRLCPIRWTGQRTLDLHSHAHPERVCPVRIHTGAFGEGLPHRDLCVSPGHALYVDGVLIQAERLVNGVTVVQEDVPAVTYWHVELERHDVLLAEGLPAESYLDTGNRTAFEGGGAFLELHPDFRPRHWAETCAPLVQEGPVLETVKARLLARAADAFGAATTDDPGLHVWADGMVILPCEVADGLARFHLPPGCRDVQLASRSWVPSYLLSASTDMRCLGVCVRHLVVDGEALRLDDARLGDGWHEAEQDPAGAQRWTTGAARLPASITELEVQIGGFARYWAGAPAAHASRAA